MRLEMTVLLIERIRGGLWRCPVKGQLAIRSQTGWALSRPITSRKGARNGGGEVAGAGGGSIPCMARRSSSFA